MTNEKRFEITDIRLRGIPLAPMVLDTRSGKVLGEFSSYEVLRNMNLIDSSVYDD